MITFAFERHYMIIITHKPDMLISLVECTVVRLSFIGFISNTMMNTRWFNMEWMKRCLTNHHIMSIFLRECLYYMFMKLLHSCISAALVRRIYPPLSMCTQVKWTRSVKMSKKCNMASSGINLCSIHTFSHANKKYSFNNSIPSAFPKAAFPKAHHTAAPNHNALHVRLSSLPRPRINPGMGLSNLLAYCAQLGIKALEIHSTHPTESFLHLFALQIAYSIRPSQLQPKPFHACF